MHPVAPEIVPAHAPEQRAEQQDREQGAQVPGLEFEDGEAGGCAEGVFEDGAGEGVGEVVEGEGVEPEGFAVWDRRRGGTVDLGEEVWRGGAGVDGVGDVVEVGGVGAGEAPGGDVGVDVCEDEVDGGIGAVVIFVAVGGSKGAISLVGVFSSRCTRGGLLSPCVVVFDGFQFQGFIDFALEVWGGPAGAGTEVYEGVVFD